MQSGSLSLTSRANISVTLIADDGEIRRDEFVNEWLRRTPGPGAEMQARGIFNVGDVNNDGVIADNDLTDLFVQFDRRSKCSIPLYIPLILKLLVQHSAGTAI
jgi:hypothetical protein